MPLPDRSTARFLARTRNQLRRHAYTAKQLRLKRALFRQLLDEYRLVPRRETAERQRIHQLLDNLKRTITTLEAQL